MSSLAAKVRQALDAGAPVQRAAAGYGQSGIPRA